MTRLAAAAIALALLATPVHAQKVDLSTITCKEFIDSGKETIGLLLMWMDAYFRDEDDPAVVDFDRMGKTGATLGEACAKNPTMGLMTIAEPIFTK